MNNFKSKEFKELQTKWYKKLKDDGFNDLEDRYGNLFQHNLRTIAWRNHDAIREFFFSLDEYLNITIVPDRDRTVLALWSDGMYLVDITKITEIPYPTIKKIIYKYRQIVLNRYVEDN